MSTDVVTSWDHRCQLIWSDIRENVADYARIPFLVVPEGTWHIIVFEWSTLFPRLSIITADKFEKVFVFCFTAKMFAENA